MNGILVINKPSGFSSHDICLKVKKMVGCRKTGHLGTLDPLATGVLPVCLNEATKLVPFLMDSEKEYVATLEFGVETDTQDSQGKIIARSSDVPECREEIESVFQQFKGEIFQTPPMYSALKHKGVPLYKIARKGGWVHRQKRKVFIREIEIKDFNPPQVCFRVVCTHGTYIRTLSQDIGRIVGCGAHMTKLTRIRNGKFHISQSVDLEVFDAPCFGDAVKNNIINPRQALNGMKEIFVYTILEEKIRNGVVVKTGDLKAPVIEDLCVGEKFKVISISGDLICVAESLVQAGQCSGLLSPDTKALKIIRGFLN